MRCLDEEIGARMILYGLGKLNTAEAKDFEDHLWACSHCTEKWYEMQSYLQNLSQNQEEFRQFLRAAVAEKEAAARQAEPKRHRSFLSWFLVFRPAWSLAAVLVLVVGLTGLFYYMKREPGLHPPSPGERSPIHLIEPLGNVDRVPKTFRWEQVPKAKYYSIKIREDSTGKTILEQQTIKPRFVPTSDFSLHLQADRYYKWIVEAFDEKGRILGEAEGSFKLAHKPASQL